MRRFLSSFILCICLGSGTALAAQSSVPFVILDGTVGELDSVAFFPDRGAAYDREQAKARFLSGDFEIRSQTLLDNYGFTDDVLWFAFRVLNRSTQGSGTMLEIQENNLADVRVYINRENYAGPGVWTEEASGANMAIRQRPVPVVGLVFNAALPPASESLFLIRVDNRGPNRLHFKVDTAGKVMASLAEHDAWLLGCFGALFVLVLYNVLLFVSVRDRVFLWFTLQLVFMGLYIHADSGYGYLFFWPGWAAFQAISSPFSTFCIMGTSLQFFRQYLHVRTAFPVLDRAILAHIIAVPVLIVLLLADYSLGMMVSGVLFLTAMGLILVTAGLLWRRGERRAAHVLAGMIFLFLGVGLTLLTTFGIIRSGMPLVVLSRADYAGILLQAAFFSFVLSDRVKHLRSQRDVAESKNQFKQQFIANISHEMRTPLNAIIGFAESTLTMDNLREVKDRNRLILGESERLLFQINQVLDLAKLEAGRLMVESLPFDLRESMDYLRSIHAGPALAKHLELVIRLEGRCATAVEGDRLRIEQVLRNLLDNALKFTSKGKISLIVTSQPVEPGLVRIFFTVSDTGIGIPEDKQKEIFEDFVQADPSITRRYGGTGLGISISRRLVETMGGYLQLRSRVGIGSSFTFSLVLPEAKLPESPSAVPVESVEETDIRAEFRMPPQPTVSGAGESAPAPAPISSVQVSEASGARRRILVVDDFETNRQVVAIHLSRLPVILDQAANGEEALNLLEENHYDLVLLDLFMPGLSGIDVVRHIRKSHAAGELPVLGVTASSDSADLEAAVAAGMNGMMIKPIKKADLLKRMRDFLPELE